MSAFLSRLEDHQQWITEANDAWAAIPTKIFGDHGQREEFRRVAVHEGLFRLIAKRDPDKPISNFQLTAGLNHSIQQLPNHREVLRMWTAPFHGLVHRLQSTDEADEDRDDWVELKQGKRRLDRRDVLKEVTKKKVVILEALERRQLDRVDELVNDLIAYQQVHGESQHMAKSLCDLAMEARNLGMHPLQLALTERSVNIAPGDAWSWTQYGDALLRMRRLDEALHAYTQAEAFGAKIIAGTGRAEVLIAKGHFEAALAAYDDVIRMQRENVAARTGRADLLKAMGRFDLAYAAYQDMIGDRPDNLLANMSRAAVLRGMIFLSMNKTKEAVSIFRDGLNSSSFRAQKEYFYGAFALASLHRREFRRAEQELNEIISPLLQPGANVMRMHAFGEQRNTAEVISAYKKLTAMPHVLFDELTQELHRRYVLGKEPSQDDDWVLDREVKLFLRAA